MRFVSLKKQNDYAEIVVKTSVILICGADCGVCLPNAFPKTGLLQ